jgi:hypothetical protein
VIKSELSPGFVVYETESGDTQDIVLDASSLPLPQSREPVDADDYHQRLAASVLRVLTSQVPAAEGLTWRDVDLVIAEALYRIARDIRRGRSVRIDYLGTFERKQTGRVRSMLYRADPDLLLDYQTRGMV